MDDAGGIGDNPLGKRGPKRPRYLEEWIDTELNVDVEFIYGFSRAAGFGGRAGPGKLPMIEYGRVVWFGDLKGELDGFDGMKISFVFRQALTSALYSIPCQAKSLPHLGQAIRRWVIQDGNRAVPKLILFDREKAIVQGWQKSQNWDFTNICAEANLSI